MTLTLCYVTKEEGMGVKGQLGCAVFILYGAVTCPVVQQSKEGGDILIPLYGQPGLFADIRPWILLTATRGEYCHLCFNSEKAEAQKRDVSRLKSHSRRRTRPHNELASLPPGPGSPLTPVQLQA